MNKNLHNLKTALIATIITLFSFNTVNAAEFPSFSWSASDYAAGATNVTYTFNYEIVTPAPLSIFYAYNSSGWITDYDKNYITLKLDGVETTAYSGFDIGGNAMNLRLDDASLATVGTVVEVILSNVTNESSPGSYSWSKMCTADGGGMEIDQKTSPNPIVLTPPAPATPISNAATSITTSGFTANWSSASDADKYFLDVATDAAFISLVSGYDNKDVGNATSSSVTGLNAVTDYYYRVRANNAGGTSGNSSTISVTTAKMDQTITFTSIEAKTYGDIDFDLSATASSGLAVTYNSSNPSVLSISGSTATVVAAGEVTITASQAGNATYNAASNQQTITIAKATPVIETAPNASAIVEDEAISESSLTGGSVTFNSDPVDGTFSFANPSSIPAAGTQTVDINFTPSSNNYNSISGTVSLFVDEDTDNDGIGNTTDTDDDNDGTIDTEDAFPLDENEDTDTDGDGTGDNADTDDDNDGTIDTEDAFPLDENEDTDTDGDGTGDNADTDDDNDGTIDTEDEFPLDKNEDTDTDGDGTGDNADTDDDNDGTIDTEDAFPLDTTEDTDTDGDGTGNNADTDDDNDGTIDTEDEFPLDENEDTDADNDGTGDNADTDDDNDGTIDTEDAFPLDATEDTDTDSDGTGNNADTDDDNDGTIDTEDAYPLDSTRDSENSTGISSTTENMKMNIFPNPTTEWINIELSKVNTDNSYYTIRNLAGVAVKSGVLTSSSNHINLGDLQSGMYLVEVVIGNKANITRVIKK